jgi:hypothetical protein
VRKVICSITCSGLASRHQKSFQMRSIWPRNSPVSIRTSRPRRLVDIHPIFENRRAPAKRSRSGFIAREN